MIKKYRFSSSLIFAILICFLSSSCQQTATTEQTTVTIPQETEEKNELPSMAITTLEGQQMNIKKHQGKTILVLFQPECEDCQREAVQIRNNIDAFKEYTLFFVSSAPLPQIAEFAVNFNLNSYDKVTFGQTTVQNVINTLGPIPAPSVYIYSEGGKLVKYFNGEVDIELIKNAL